MFCVPRYAQTSAGKHGQTRFTFCNFIIIAKEYPKFRQKAKTGNKDILRRGLCQLQVTSHTSPRSPLQRFGGRGRI